MATTELGDRSYLVSDGGVGLVVDPTRRLEPLRAAAASAGTAITHVFETHVHNDYVSGGLALVRQSGARYVLAAAEPVHFREERTGVADGDVLEVGALEVTVLHTPGHTAHHLSYRVRDTRLSEGAAGSEAVFTGGSLLYGAVGRTDLPGTGSAAPLARAQWRSVRRLADGLGDPTTVHPTHGFGSHCAAQTSLAVDGATVGEERARNPALLQDEEAFVKSQLAALRPFPSYYAFMAPRNRRGPPMPVRAPRRVAPALVVERAAAGEHVIDLRPGPAFAAGHLRGALNIGWRDSFPTYVGWTVPWGAPLTLIAEDEAQLDAAGRALALIGIDEVDGTVGGPALRHPERYRVARFADLAEALRRGEPCCIVDARDPYEYEGGHLEGARAIPFYDLEAASVDLPGDAPVWVHCALGYRAAIGASLVTRSGRTAVLIDDTWEQAERVGVAIGRASATGPAGAPG